MSDIKVRKLIKNLIARILVLNIIYFGGGEENIVIRRHITNLEQKE